MAGSIALVMAAHRVRSDQRSARLAEIERPVGTVVSAWARRTTGADFNTPAAQHRFAMAAGAVAPQPESPRRDVPGPRRTAVASGGNARARTASVMVSLKTVLIAMSSEWRAAALASALLQVNAGAAGKSCCEATLSCPLGGSTHV